MEKEKEKEKEKVKDKEKITKSKKNKYLNNDNINLFKKVIRFMFPYKKTFIFGISSIIIANIALVLSFVLVGNIIDSITKRQIGNLKNMIILFVLANIIYAVTNFLGTYRIAKISQKIMYNIRKELFFKTQTAHISYFNKNSSGEILSIYANDLEVLSFVIDQSFVAIIVQILKIIITFGILIYLNMYIALFILLIILIYIFLTKFLGKKTKISSKESQNAYAKFSGFTQESINGLKTIKIYNTKIDRIENFNNLADSLGKSQAKTSFLQSLTEPLSSIISTILFIFFAIFGIYLITKGMATIGTILIYFQIANNLISPFKLLSTHVTSVFKAIPAAKRIFNLIDYQSEIFLGKYTIKSIDNGSKSKDNVTKYIVPLNNRNSKNEKYEKNKKEIPFDGSIEFKNVFFKYDDYENENNKNKDNNKTEKYILEDISFKVLKGQTIALVGKTGSGKTTILNLINRFYEINENNGKGEILLSGVNINDINKRDIRKCVSTILQDSKLFSGTIAENISYGKSNATLDEIISAAKSANAHQFISKLKDGYDTVIDTKNLTLSHGEIQLISIARAILANTEILLLDEATSSVDIKSEKLIQEALNKITEDKTTIIIAHRLSTIKNADCIFVISDGNIVERGTHKELIDMKGTYFNMYNV